jgi:rod shape-determining protein MreC
MESVLGRYRNLTILVGVLFLQVLGLAVQVKRSTEAEHTRLIRIWVVDAITPLERGLVQLQNGGRNLWNNYCFLRGVRAENRNLKEQVEQLRLAQVRLSEDAGQAHRLQALLAFKEQFIAKTVPAQVIGSSGSDLSRSIYIDKGSSDGITADMPVITAGGIVGKVLRVYPSTSLVLMISDQSSGVGALLEKSRLQGVLRGTPDGELILERVMSDEQVAPGEVVLSSGGDQVFPKGLPVGTVTKASPGKEMFLNIHVKPAADLSRLEEVLVVTEKQARAPVADIPAARVRAADILAQRLPSVPDKTNTASDSPTITPNGAAEQNLSATPVSGNANTTTPAASEQTNTAPSSVRSTALGEKNVTIDALKTAVQKTGSDQPASDGQSGVTKSTSSATGPDVKPAGAGNSPKPATSRLKPSNPQPTPKAPTEHNPH